MNRNKFIYISNDLPDNYIIKVRNMNKNDLYNTSISELKIIINNLEDIEIKQKNKNKNSLSKTQFIQSLLPKVSKFNEIYKSNQIYLSTVKIPLELYDKSTGEIISTQSINNINISELSIINDKIDEVLRNIDVTLTSNKQSKINEINEILYIIILIYIL